MQKDMSSLLTLQNLMKRDPKAYTDEFMQQFRHFQSTLQIFIAGSGKSEGEENKPAAKASKDFCALISFLSRVAPCFRTQCKDLPGQLVNLLENHAEKLDNALRRTVVQSLIILQNRNLIDRLVLLPVLFRLFRSQDKQLRELLFSHIVSDIKNVNRKGQNHKLNNTLQNFMFTMLKDENTTAAKKSLDVMIELWRRRVWIDAKSVNAISTACFHPDPKIMVPALKFFLGVEQIDEEQEKADRQEAGELNKQLKQVGLAMKSIKRKTKRERELKRAVAKIRAANAEDKEDRVAHSSVRLGYPAIQLVHDPQSLAERLFSLLKRSAHSFEIRMLLMNVISRLTGAHKLLLLDFYPFLQKYIQAHQRSVTLILTFLAQSSHDLVPPEILRPCVKTLANNFVTDRSSPDVMAVGLNAIREVAARAPLVLTRDLVHDLAQYKRSKFKGVMMASKSLIALVRDANPALLAKKDRSREAQIGVMDGKKAPEYGADTIQTSIPGLELLAKEVEEGRAMDPNDPKAWEVKQTQADSDEDEDDDDDDDLDITLSDIDEGQVVDGDEEPDQAELAEAEMDALLDNLEEGDGDDEDGEGDDDAGAEDDAGDLNVSVDADNDPSLMDEEEEEIDEVDPVDAKTLGAADTAAVPKSPAVTKSKQKASKKEQKTPSKKAVTPLKAPASAKRASKKSKASADYIDLSNPRAGVDDEKEEVQEPKAKKLKLGPAIIPGSSSSSSTAAVPSSASSALSSSSSSSSSEPQLTEAQKVKLSRKERKKAALWTEKVTVDEDGEIVTSKSASAPSESKEEPSGPASEDGSETKALPLQSVRLLTPADLERIKELQTQALITGGRKKRKRFQGETVDSSAQLPGEVSVESIIGWQKKGRASYEDRLKGVLDSRAEGESRKEYGKKLKRKGGGTTNQEKVRNKPFAMVLHKAKGKAHNASFTEKQGRLSAHIQTVKKSKKNKNRRRL